ncbi:hypothetical protein SAY86_016271 [Trapa natans]|uniref:adenine phosphoribosyltransferase n=1 Tax=Trapa natans TaxID=22666 RepID=A0AAN7LCV0_TRANT|nr:hypothetical protein SAY86_016271 [Trapa natans]
MNSFQQLAKFRSYLFQTMEGNRKSCIPLSRRLAGEVSSPDFGWNLNERMISSRVSHSTAVHRSGNFPISPNNRLERAASVRPQHMETGDASDPRITRIASSIRVIPDFPKPGILFQDITTLLLDIKAFRDTIDLFVERYKEKGISVVAGVEARGFIFGPPIALAIGAKFIPMRKPHKLPGPVISEEYSLEYGTDVMEMHVGAVEPGEKVLVIDDLIATGGTLCAAIKLLERVGAVVVECACVIELPELKGRDRLGDKPLFVLVSPA